MSGFATDVDGNRMLLPTSEPVRAPRNFTWWSKLEKKVEADLMVMDFDGERVERWKRCPDGFRLVEVWELHG